MTVAFMTIDATVPRVETLRLFSSKAEALAWFEREYAPENQEDDDDFENSQPMLWFRDDVNQLRHFDIADSGGDVYYIIKEVEQ